MQQQISKEYQQIKAIQKELTEMTMDLHNAPLRRNTASVENESRDPAAWFRPDPDIWAPPMNRDPDVFAPPIDRYESFFGHFIFTHEHEIMIFQRILFN